ncbi:MAG: peptidylprolyl isomerase [Clostridium sp.]|nr:peptidylprolyl isomerase [Clostridium sp.]MCM1399717.1 peptidylprolyl isomerase [Clostridium sp.]MCM1460448.1 peptidylprolyl isomerase [Bacteroides sp.]
MNNTVNGIKLRARVVIFMVLFCVAFTSCGKEELVEQQDDTVVFSYGGSDVTVGEVYIYYLTVKENYEALYGEDVWTMSIATEADAISVSALLREAVIDEIVRIKTLVAHATEYDIALTDADKKKLEEQALEFYNGLTDEDIERLDVDAALVTKVLTECNMAQSVEEALLAKDPVEISLEQARMTTFYDLYFNCYETNGNGDIVPLSEENQKKQYENAVDACGLLTTATIENDEESEIRVEDVATLYKLDMSGEYTYSPAQIKKTYGEDICDMLYAMENGEHSTVVETEYGYHVFKMIALTDEDATMNKKNQMTNDAINEKLGTTLEDWKLKMDRDFKYPDSINMDVYDNIL